MSHPEQLGFTDNSANRYQVNGPAGQLQEALGAFGIEKVDESLARELINHATLESAMQTLDFINATVCGVVERPDHTEKTSFVGSTRDGKEVIGQLLLPPRYRADFMRYTLDKARTADTQNHKANILAHGTVLAHNFADGNGRTARVVAALVAEGFDPQSPESVANINSAATSREVMEKRPASFAPDYSMKRSWIATELQHTNQTEQFQEIQKQMVAELATETEDGGSRYIDPDKIDAHLSRINDEDLHVKLRRAIQQDEFGAMVLRDAMTQTHTDSISEAMEAIDTMSAENIIAQDEDRKLAYSKYVIDIAAGESKPYYSHYGAAPVQDGITDKHMIGYH